MIKLFIFQAYLDFIYEKFDINGAKRVKEIEAITNHDVKAVEYYIKEKLEESKYFLKILEYNFFIIS